MSIIIIFSTVITAFATAIIAIYSIINYRILKSNEKFIKDAEGHNIEVLQYLTAATLTTGNASGSERTTVGQFEKYLKLIKEYKMKI